jgi:hypothetical protein
MSEIEKMYSNAGIKCLHPLGFCKHIGATCEVCERHKCPPFTAEKQIELIKFITSLGVCEIENWNDKGFHFAIKRERIYPTMFLSLSNINLQETLADVINNLWQDLTEEEKQQIKEILSK